MPRRKKATRLTLKYGSRLRALRLERGLTLAAVGEGADDEGNLNGHVSNIEHGRVLPTVGVLNKIAANMGVELPYLLTDPGASPRQGLIERTRYLTEAEVEHWLAELGPPPVLPPRPIVRARRRPVEKGRKTA